MNKVLLIILVIFTLILVSCSDTNIQKYDEVIYDCEDSLVKGTQVPNSTWDLENGVEVYYLYANNYSIEFNYPIREWFENYDAVGLYDDCKEILRFYNYTLYINNK